MSEPTYHLFTVLLGFISVAVAVLVAFAGFAIKDRRYIGDKLTELAEKVGKQNGRVGNLEKEVERIKKDFEDTWSGKERRRHPRFRNDFEDR